MAHHTLTYDCIVMNPPFSANRDVNHVVKALEYLNDGGTLCAIMSKHWMFANDKASVYFRDLVDRLGADVTPIAGGLFKDTKIETVMVCIRR